MKWVLVAYLYTGRPGPTVRWNRSVAITTRADDSTGTTFKLCGGRCYVRAPPYTVNGGSKRTRPGRRTFIYFIRTNFPNSLLALFKKCWLSTRLILWASLAPQRLLQKMPLRSVLLTTIHTLEGV